MKQDAGKISKERARFEHPAKGMDHCKDCVHFQPEQKACEIVAGVITPKDWCKYFRKGKTNGQ